MNDLLKNKDALMFKLQDEDEVEDFMKMLYQKQQVNSQYDIDNDID